MRSGGRSVPTLAGFPKLSRPYASQLGLTLYLPYWTPYRLALAPATVRMVVQGVGVAYGTPIWAHGAKYAFSKIHNVGKFQGSNLGLHSSPFTGPRILHSGPMVSEEQCCPNAGGWSQYAALVRRRCVSGARGEDFRVWLLRLLAAPGVVSKGLARPAFPRVRLWRYTWRVMAWRFRRNLKIWAAQGEPVLVRGGVFYWWP
jgi:hypothetical protein